jgi:hypothetical protein
MNTQNQQRPPSHDPKPEPKVNEEYIDYEEIK